MGSNSALTSGIMAIVALAAMIYIVYSYTQAQKPEGAKEGMALSEHGYDAGSSHAEQGTHGAPMPCDPASSGVRGVDFPRSSEQDENLPNDCFPKDRLVAEDLLPKDGANEKWARVNPAGQGDVDDKNYLSAGYLTGINTVSGTLRNANLQIRSEPPNPRARVSVWQQSTIEPDLNRRPFEIDGGCY